jgi:hypothetical protein
MSMVGPETSEHSIEPDMGKCARLGADFANHGWSINPRLSPWAVLRALIDFEDSHIAAQE